MLDLDARTCSHSTVPIMADAPSPATATEPTTPEPTAVEALEDMLGLPNDAERAHARAESRARLKAAGVEPSPVERAWRSDGFGSLGWDWDIELPCLVLAVPAASVDLIADTTHSPPRFAGGRRWLAVDHQSAGLSCHHPRFIATILSLRSSAAEELFRLALHYESSNISSTTLSLDELVEYRTRLTDRLGVDCNWTFSDLAEAIYPIDPTPENLARLTDDGLPEDLDDLLDFSLPPDELTDLDVEQAARARALRGLIGSANRWRCYWLAANSD